MQMEFERVVLVSLLVSDPWHHRATTWLTCTGTAGTTLLPLVNACEMREGGRDSDMGSWPRQQSSPDWVGVGT